MHQKPRLTLIVSQIDRWVQFEWIAEALRERGYAPSFIILNDKPGYFEKYLEENKFQFVSVKFSGARDFFSSSLRVYKILQRWSSEVVHCHFLWGSLIGLTGARLAGVPVRIHSRHHAEFHHQNHPKAVYYDRYINFLSTGIIAISETVKNILVKKEFVPPSKITVIHHGFHLERFANPNPESVALLKRKYELDEAPLVIGVVSRLIDWKGVPFIIDGFKRFRAINPDAVLVLANARGPEREKIIQQLNDLPAKNIRWIEFEKDLFSLFHLFHIFVHCPTSPSVEAFGQVYIEAAASRRACVFTRSGIANEIFVDGEHALFVGYKAPDEIADAIAALAKNPLEATRMGQKAQTYVLKKFELATMIDGFEELYLK